MAGQSDAALRDLVGSLKQLPLAFVLAGDDLQARYRRTVLGPLWIVIAQAATIAGFVLVFSGLFRVRPEGYAVYLAAGFPVWTFISSFLSEMPVVFVGAKGFIESYDVPWLTHIWRRTIGYLIIFLHQLLILFVVIAVMVARGHAEFFPRWEMLLAIPAVVIVSVAGAGAGAILASLGARYRDLQQAMVVLASFLFLFTPVMWHADQLEHNKWVFLLNPLYYYMEVLRDPLLGQAPEPAIWIGATIGAIVLFILGFVSFRMSQHRLYHWL